MSDAVSVIGPNIRYIVAVRDRRSYLNLTMHKERVGEVLLEYFKENKLGIKFGSNSDITITVPYSSYLSSLTNEGIINVIKDLIKEISQYDRKKS